MGTSKIYIVNPASRRVAPQPGVLGHPCDHSGRLEEVATEEPFDDSTLRIDFVQQKVTIDRTPVNLKPPSSACSPHSPFVEARYSPPRSSWNCSRVTPDSLPTEWRMP
jgi:hypothetical protein